MRMLPSKKLMTLIHEDIESKGIEARILMSDYDKIRIVFKSLSDMHLYEVSGQYDKGTFWNYGIEFIEFRYGLWQHIVSYFINKRWDQILIWGSWIITAIITFYRILFYNH